MAGTVILSIAYGIDVQLENDKYVNIAEKALNAMASTGNAGSYFVDQIPLLKYLPESFPGAGFKTQAKEWNRAVSAMPHLPFEFAKNAKVSTIYTYIFQFRS